MGGGTRRLRIPPNQTVWIVTIFVLLISIMVGYSVLDNDLGISGQSTISTSTLVKISKLEVKEVTGNVEVSSSVDGNIKGIMETIFTGSGTATFTGTVVNMGSTEAILSTINLLNESNNSSPTCITMSIDGLKVGDTLTPSQEQNFTVKVTSTCDQASTKTNEFSLSYIPVNANEGTTTIDEQLNALRSEIITLQEENTSLKNDLNSIKEKSSLALYPRNVHDYESKLDNLDFVNEDEIYLLRWAPIAEEGKQYIQGGTSHVILGYEYYNRTYGFQISFGVEYIRWRSKISGNWTAWKMVASRY